MSAAAPLALRPERPEDEAFLFALFAEEAVPMLRLAGCDAAQALQLARMQHRSRSAGYRDGDTRFAIATLEGVPVGRLVERRAADRLHVVDLAVAQAWRHRGLATALLGAVIARAREAGLAVTLGVAATNAPALALYRKHGFACAGETPPDLLMRLEP